MNSAGDAPGVNPFISRRLRPGSVPYVEPSPGLVSQLADRFLASPRGQIVGPHGSGKSALLQAVVGELERRGWSAATCALRTGQRRLPDHVWRNWPTGRCRLLAIDGFEQLARSVQWRVRWRSWRRGTGLLATAHAPIGLPTLYATTATLATARLVVQRLQSGFPELVADADVAQAFAHCQGDIRETLFALYDLYEARRSEW